MNNAVLEYKTDLVDTIIENDLSFALIEATRFRKLLVSGRSDIQAILPASHNTIKAWVLDSFKSRKIQIKHKISLARSKINLSLDGWKAPNCDDYIAICAHFVDDEYKLVHCLIGFRCVFGAKSGQATGEITAARTLQIRDGSFDQTSEIHCFPSYLPYSFRFSV